MRVVPRILTGVVAGVCVMAWCPLKMWGQAVRKEPSFSASEPHCVLGSVDTSTWIRSTNQALGVSFRHPPTYRVKDWGSVSTGAPSAWTWWHEDGPVWSMEFTKTGTVSDSTRRAAYERLPEHRTCALQTSAGLVTVHLFRNGKAGYGPNAVTLYNAEMDWPMTTPGTALRLSTVSRDERRLVEQLASARTVLRR
jgi:hypothetical protein